MGLAQRAADLCQHMDHPSRRLTAVPINQLLQGESVEVLHRVVEYAVGCAPVVEDGDSVRVGELSRELDLPSKPLQVGRTRPVRV